MKPELDAKLCEQFPLLYKNRNASRGGSNMRFGFCVGDGWFQIIYDLSAKLEPLIQQHDGLNHPVASQVKEKFGGLRFYMDNATDEMNKYIAEAEELAGKTCEICGRPGTRGGSGWIKTKCDECRSNNARSS